MSAYALDSSSAKGGVRMTEGTFYGFSTALYVLPLAAGKITLAHNSVQIQLLFHLVDDFHVFRLGDSFQCLLSIQISFPN